jgi:hypothetical protein
VEVRVKSAGSVQCRPHIADQKVWAMHVRVTLDKGSGFPAKILPAMHIRRRYVH